jgi:hypothetical protein
MRFNGGCLHRTQREKKKERKKEGKRRASTEKEKKTTTQIIPDTCRMTHLLSRLYIFLPAKRSCSRSRANQPENIKIKQALLITKAQRSDINQYRTTTKSYYIK